MKNLFTLIFSLIIFSVPSFANHSELVIYAPNGEAFFLELDGRRQNQSPNQKVKATNLTRSNYDIRVRFANRRLGHVFFNSVNIHRDSRNIFRLVSNRRGDFILEFERKKPLYTQKAPTYPTRQCYQPIDKYMVADIQHSIELESFKGDKMRVAKRMVRNQCLSSRQVRRLMQSFTFENSKLEFAKFAFERTIDPEKYYIVSEALTYKSSKRELNRYMEQVSRNHSPYNQSQHYDDYEVCTHPSHGNSQSKNHGHNGQYGKSHQGQYGKGHQGHGHNKPKHQGGNYGKGNQGSYNHGKNKPQYQGGNYGQGHSGKPYGGSYQGSCSSPMTDAQFRGSLRNLKRQGHDQSKMRMAKEIISSNCMKSVQIAEFMEVMQFEKSRLVLAKYGYQFAYDPNNYAEVNHSFDHASSIRELDRFLR